MTCALRSVEAVCRTSRGFGASEGMDEDGVGAIGEERTAVKPRRRESVDVAVSARLVAPVRRVDVLGLILTL